MYDMNNQNQKISGFETTEKEHKKHYDPHHPINFKRLLLANDGYIIGAEKDSSDIYGDYRDDGDYIHPVDVRTKKNPENGIEIDFYNELVDSDKLVTLRIQFRKGHTCMGWICNSDGSLRKKPNPHYKVKDLDTNIEF